jgi:sensor histidine kinase YesM
MMKCFLFLLSFSTCDMLDIITQFKVKDKSFSFVFCDTPLVLCTYFSSTFHETISTGYAIDSYGRESFLCLTFVFCFLFVVVWLIIEIMKDMGSRFSSGLWLIVNTNHQFEGLLETSKFSLNTDLRNKCFEVKHVKLTIWTQMRFFIFLFYCQTAF